MRRRLLSLADAAWREPKTFLIVMAGLAVLAASTLVLLAASEDVMQRNGAATLDAARLHWVTDHRWNPLIALARFLDRAGSVAVVVVLAIGVGVWLWRRGLPVIVAATPLAAMIIAEAGAAVLKTTVGRARPASGLRLVSGLALWFVASEHGEDSTGEQSLSPLRQRVAGILGRRRTHGLLFTTA